MNNQSDYPLGPYRVLDLTDEKGYLCGSTMAGLGAEVIKIEPVGGDAGRDIGPFFKDIREPEKSLFWLGLNAGKKGVTLNLESHRGGEIFKQLAQSADFILESYTPGYMDTLGLGYEALYKINPKLVLTSITPYGFTGPHSKYKGPEIACWAGSGYMWLNGYPDRAPLRFTFPQAYYHGCIDAVVGSMMAFWHRQMSGEGQHVDVSIQESIAFECLSAQQSWDMNRFLLKREGLYRVFGSYRVRYPFPCKDGNIIFNLVGGHIGAPGQKALTAWMDSLGYADDYLKNLDWEAFDAATYDDAQARKMEAQFERFFLTRTKKELMEMSAKHGIMIAPMNDVKDMLESPQFKARDFFVEIDYPELGTSLTYPGAPFKSEQILWKTGVRAPRIGEHNDEIYRKGLGISGTEMAALSRGGVI